MPGSIHVVIVNWNTGTHLRECLESIARANSQRVNLVRVTVIDNNSSDGSANALDDVDLPLDVIHNRTNLGFATACNQGAAGSEADYLLFLNPDTRLFRNTLGVVSAFMDTRDADRVGICGCDVLDSSGRRHLSCARFPTLRISFGMMSGLDRFLPRLFPSHQLSPAEMPKSGKVDQVIGAFFFVRHSLFTSLGGFDTRYFIYYEEVDFAWRASQRGFHSYFVKEAKVLHAYHTSSAQVPDVRLYHSLRSRLIYAGRHWPRWQVITLGVLTFGLELPVRLVKAFLQRNRSDFSATSAAYRKLVSDLRGKPVGAGDVI
jgi:N-acetylglucosaminyl-diphospho-decaprenol L-rhamnosyltransferase